MSTDVVTPEVVHTEIATIVNKLGCVTVERIKTSEQGVRMLLRRNDVDTWNTVVHLLLQEQESYSDVLSFSVRLGTHAFLLPLDGGGTQLAYAAFMEVDFKDPFTEDGTEWMVGLKQLRSVFNNVRIRLVDHVPTNQPSKAGNRRGLPKVTEGSASTGNQIEIPARLVRNPKMVRLTDERVSLSSKVDSTGRNANKVKTTSVVKGDTYDGPSSVVGFIRTPGSGGSMTVKDHVDSLNAYNSAHSNPGE